MFTFNKYDSLLISFSLYLFNFHLGFIKINFLTYILHQEKEALLFKMLHAHQTRPASGDWFSRVEQIMLDILNIVEIEDIQKITRREFKTFSSIF